MMPVVVYPKEYLNEIREEINQVKASEQPVFDTVDSLFEKLEEKQE